MSQMLDESGFSTRFREASKRLLIPKASSMEADRAIDADFARVAASGALPNRHFHTLDHYAAVADTEVDGANGAPSLRTILAERRLAQSEPMVRDVITRAAAHHDTIYLRVDGGMTPETATQLAPFVLPDHDGYCLRPEAADSLIGRLALSVFGLVPGGQLAASGQNEFLSVLDAGIEGMKTGIAPKYILAEMAMIEATIPFRDGTRFETLESRLRAANRLLPEGERLGESAPDEIEAILYGAVQLANRDVVGFRRPHDVFAQAGQALWREEQVDTQTLGGLFRASYGEAMFLGSLLDPAHDKRVFHGWRGFPSEAQLAEWNGAAESNIRQSRDEMGRAASAIRFFTHFAQSKGVFHPEINPLGTLCDPLKGARGFFPEAVARLAHDMSDAQADALFDRELAKEIPGFSTDFHTLHAIAQPRLLQIPLGASQGR